MRKGQTQSIRTTTGCGKEFGGRPTAVWKEKAKPEIPEKIRYRCAIAVTSARLEFSAAWNPGLRNLGFGVMVPRDDSYRNHSR